MSSSVYNLSKLYHHKIYYEVLVKVTERKRQDFVKSTWNQYQKAIDTADSPKLKSIYKTLRNDIDSADPESDLQ